MVEVLHMVSRDLMEEDRLEGWVIIEWEVKATLEVVAINNSLRCNNMMIGHSAHIAVGNSMILLPKGIFLIVKIKLKKLTKGSALNQVNHLE